MCTNESFTKIVEETAKMFSGDDTDCCIMAKSIKGDGDIAMAGSEVGLIYCIHRMLKEIAVYNNTTLEDIVEYIKRIESGGAGTLKTEAHTIVFPLTE